MAKDMSKVYGEMLTGELVRLRAKHIARVAELSASGKRADQREAANLRDLLAQINSEMAARVAQFMLKV